MKKMLQELLKSASNSTSVTYRTVHCMQKSRQELCKFTSSSQDLSIIYLKVVNSHRFSQSDLDTRSWYHGTAASKECLQAPLRTLSSPDRSRLVPLPLGYLALNPAGSLFAGYRSFRLAWPGISPLERLWNCFDSDAELFMSRS